MRQTSDAERRQLGETFAALCRIESPSGRERPCTDYVAAELRAMGLEVAEDRCGPEVASDAGNLLARVRGRSGATILLCAHLDTVPLAAPVEPVVVNGGWENSREAILGADNKAAVAVMLELARRMTRAENPPDVGIELLFTVCEEVALRGAKAFDAGQLQSPFGYVFDHASPIGEIVLASPTYYRIEAVVRGRAAHAGIRPENGRSAIAAAAKAIAAMPLGRLDPETTSNVGTISGGSNANVVPELCRVEAEARSLSANGPSTSPPRWSITSRRRPTPVSVTSTSPWRECSRATASAPESRTSRSPSWRFGRAGLSRGRSRPVAARMPTH